MKRCMLAFLFLFLFFTETNAVQAKINEKGDFVIGARSTVSAFGHSGYVGVGAGGHFRLQFLDRLSTEWFADIMRTNVGDLALREDYHIGWSVMFYLMKKSRFWSPYLIGGHCFDYTAISQLKTGNDSQGRWSSAVQLGVGNHFRISENADLTLSIQYMIHLGEDLVAEIENVGGVNIATIEKHPLSLEGHVLFTLSINYRVATLW